MFDAIKKFIGSKNDRELKKVRPIVAQINSMEERFANMSDEELQSMTPRFKQLLEGGKTLDDILPAAFAVVREAGKRVLGMRHYDVQLIGGYFLHKGMIAEMRTGEGKTLVATLPVYLNALEGQGAHVITVNEYLASRDAEWMGQLYNFLGMSVGVIQNDMSSSERVVAYAADITYGTNNEFGFDYLRDNMKLSASEKAQRARHYAIVDEVDSILIDEARTPLIISGRADQSTELYFEINKIIPFLHKDEDYLVDEEHHSVVLTDEGVIKTEKRLGITNLYEPNNIEYLHHVNKALQAHTLYKKDNNYIVDDGEVIIVDEHTGRPMPGRRWSDGLHQAVEAKEGVKIKDENQTLATITFQNFFRMYNKLSGMTGTAETEAEEFKEIYGLEVRVIPTNKPVIRQDHNDVIYRTEKEKFRAIVDQIVLCYEKDQPVLVGTVSVEKSEAISKVLRRKKIRHSVLNAKYHRQEADIVAQAGRKGAITIATNMAGRGTDILLGGNPEALARDEAGAEEGPAFEAALAKHKAQCKQEREEVLAAGGLFILATERHESRRIDNQLRGRAGRQGDPGESRFYLSLEDDLMRIFGGERLSFVMEKLDMPEGEPIESRMVSRSLENAQRRVEGRNFDIRKNLLDYDDVMNQQRQAIYDLRDKVLDGGDPLYDKLLESFDRVATRTVDSKCPEKVRPTDWDMQGLHNQIKEIFGLELTFAEEERVDTVATKVWSAVEGLLHEKIQKMELIAERSNARYKEDPDFEPKVGKDIFLEVAQGIYLKAIDEKWREHLKQMAALRDAIRFHGYAQKDPKKVYKIEGYEVFSRTMGEIEDQVVEFVSKVQVESEEQVHDAAPSNASMTLRPLVLPTASGRPEVPPAMPQVAKAPSASSGGPVSLADMAAQQQAQARRIRSVNPNAGAQYSAGSGAPAAPQAPTPGEMPQAATDADTNGAEAPQVVERVLRKIGRNDFCPCGSGKKFKHCHMGREGELERPEA